MNKLITTNDNAILEPYQVVKWVLDGIENLNTRRAYNRHLLEFVGWHQDQGQPKLSKAVVSAYKAHLVQTGRGPSVVNQQLAALRHLAREAVDNSLIDEQTGRGIANVKGIKNETLPAGRDIKAGELYSLLAACDSSPIGIRDGAIVAILYSTGMRRSELVSLDLDNYQDGQLTILKAKGNKQRTAYLENGAAVALGDWLAIRGDAPGPLFVRVYRSGLVGHTRLTSQAVYDLLGKRARQAGIESSLSPHDFRRTFVGDLLDRGADIVTVQKLVGHQDPGTTARYDRRDESAKRKAVKLLHVPYTTKVNL